MNNNIDNIHTATPENTEELTQLRSQMQQLRARLDSQNIISDKLLRDVVRRSTQFSRSYFKMEKFILLPMALVSFFFLYFAIGLPVWYLAFTFTILIVELISDWQINNLARLDYGNTPLLKIQQRLIKQKKQRAIRMLAGMITLVVWLALSVWVVGWYIAPDEGFIPEKDTTEFYYGMSFGGIIGGIVGLTIGIRAYLRMQRENDRAIALLSDYNPS